MKKIFIILLFSSVMFGALFEQGSKNIGITVGTGSSYNSNYTILGINASYFVADNLMSGLEYRGWFGGDPMINEVSIPVTYFVPLHEKYFPYFGGFFRRTFVDSPEIDSYSVYGARFGISIITSGNSYASFGWVQEYYDNADNYEDSSDGYPEISVGLSF